MVKKYRRLTDEERENLVTLIHVQGYTIKDASRELGIPYPNAKAVNQTFILENRTAKKNYRYRIKDPHFGCRPDRSSLQNLLLLGEAEVNRRICGVRKLRRNNL